jgi:hypothetical protein
VSGLAPFAGTPADPARFFRSPEADSADQRSRYLELQFDQARAAIDELVAAIGCSEFDVLDELRAAYEVEAAMVADAGRLERSS